MNEDTLNIEIRKFLKKVGITSQREIEHAITRALEEGSLCGNEQLDVTMTLEVPGLAISYRVDGKITLE